ncbi:MAG: LysM domain-containing protein [Patescibacteria group bacterium]
MAHSRITNFRINDYAVVERFPGREDFKPNKSKKLFVALGLVASLLVGREIVDNLNGIECSDKNTTVIVSQGDTFWSIAEVANDEQFKNKLPTGELVYAIEARNPNLKAGNLAVGNTVLVPESCEN